MNVAACFTGEARTLHLPCTMRATLDRMVRPLHADVFAILNVGTSAEVPRVQMQLEAMLRDAFPEGATWRPLQRLLVYAYNAADVDATTPIEIKTTSMSAAVMRVAPQRLAAVRNQAHALLRAASLIFAERIAYDWILRLRTDIYVPYVLQSLPTAAQMLTLTRHSNSSGATAIENGDIYPSHLFVDYVLGHCADEPDSPYMRARWTDDRMAFLPGLRAQEAYLVGYARDFLRRPTIRETRSSSAECQLGWTLAARALDAVGIGGNWRSRIRILRDVARNNTVPHSRRCEDLGPSNYYPTQPWPVLAPPLDANGLLTRLRS